MSWLLELLPFGGVLSFVTSHLDWLGPIVGGAFTLAGTFFGGPIFLFIRRNWTWLLPTAAFVVALVFIGVQEIQIAHRDTTIAQRDAAIDNMKRQQAENIARAEAAVRSAMQADAEKSNEIIARYAGEIAELQENRNAAEVAIAAVPVASTPAGCPDPMSLPVVDAFLRGLPTGAGAAQGRGTGAGPSPGAGRAEGAVPAPAR